MKKLYCVLFLILPFHLSHAQAEERITGQVLDARTRLPLQAAVVRLVGTSISTLTDREGVFYLQPEQEGNCELELVYPTYVKQRLTVTVPASEPVDVGTLLLQEDWVSTEQLGLIQLEETELEDAFAPTATTARLLQATKDAFQQMAAFSWGPSFYRLRGLDNAYGKTLLNGISMNKIYNGRPQWSQWGGLNDATRIQVVSPSSTPAQNTFGGLGGTQSIYTRASSMRKGLRLGLAGTTTTYLWKPFLTYASGLKANGWAYAFAAAYRGAKESYWQGTNYDALSLFIGIEKQFNEHHHVYFSGMYARNKRAKNSSNTQEVTQLKGFRYNAYWGLQGGEKRNARIQTLQEPLFMLTHVWTLNEQTSLTTTASYQWGYQAQTNLDYQDNLNPDPTYYKNLPSYYLTQIDETYGNRSPSDVDQLPQDDPFKQTVLMQRQQAQQAQAFFLENGQLDWEELYRKNKGFQGQSKIVQFEDRKDDQNLGLATSIRLSLTDHITLHAGIQYRNLYSTNYKKLVDLLGGTYYKDMDTYQKEGFQDSNLHHPNRIVYPGDSYGYHYNLYANVADVFTQLIFRYPKLELYLAEQASFSNYQREGRYQHPLYPTHSYGRSKRVSFTTLGIKGGITYYLSGKHVLEAHLAYSSQAPMLQYTFVNMRVNNDIAAPLQPEQLLSAESSYRFRSPRWQARLTAYATAIQNATQLNFFYAEGLGLTEAKGSLIAELATALDTRHLGLEFGSSYALTPAFKINMAVGIGQSYYTRDPDLYISTDGLAKPLAIGKAQLTSYKVANGPQTALGLGIEYRDPSFWFISANWSYLADAYVRIAPLKRTEAFFRDPELQGRPYEGLTTEILHRVWQQEKLPAYSLFSLTGGKSWRVLNRATLGLFFSIQNLFNTVYRTGGFEQGRNATYAQEKERTTAHSSVFGTKYWYGYGRQCFIQLYYNF